MDWNGFANAIILLITGGAFSLVGNIVYRKYRKKSEKLEPDRKEIEVADAARQNAYNSQLEVGEWHQKVNELYDKTSEMKSEIGELKSQLDDNRRVIDEIQEMLTRQVGRKKYAESHLCTVVDCVLRTPPLGSYKSDDDSLDKYVKLNKNIKKNEL